MIYFKDKNIIERIAARIEAVSFFIFCNCILSFRLTWAGRPAGMEKSNFEMSPHFASRHLYLVNMTKNIKDIADSQTRSAAESMSTIKNNGDANNLPPKKI